MSVKMMDNVYARWLQDAEFRTLMHENPELALAEYPLTQTERRKLSLLSRRVRKLKPRIPKRTSFRLANIAMFSLN